MLFEEQASNIRFTKRGCRLVMGVPDGDGPHACGRFSLWQKGSFIARQMLNEWWAYSINRECQLWDGSHLKDLGGNAIKVDPTGEAGFRSDYNLYMLGQGSALAFWENRAYTNRADWLYEVAQDAHSQIADAALVNPLGADGVLGWSAAAATAPRAEALRTRAPGRAPPTRSTLLTGAAPFGAAPPVGRNAC